MKADINNISDQQYDEKGTLCKTGQGDQQGDVDMTDKMNMKDKGTDVNGASEKKKDIQAIILLFFVTYMKAQTRPVQKNSTVARSTEDGWIGTVKRIKGDDCAGNTDWYQKYVDTNAENV